jgi:hypothetical protein
MTALEGPHRAESALDAAFEPPQSQELSAYQKFRPRPPTNRHGA